MKTFKFDIRHKVSGQTTYEYLAEKVSEAAIYSIEHGRETVKLIGNLGYEDMEKLKALTGLYPIVKKEIRSRFSEVELVFNIDFVAHNSD